MVEFKFIHAADLHIDSPLRGLETYAGAPVEQLRGATRVAFENLISLALEKQVAFVVIAGDLFDRQWPDMNTGLWTAEQFRRLQVAEIPVYLIRGNHDAASKVRQAVRWPANVHEFSVRKPESLEIQECGVVLHGQGFSHRECPDDLAANYPDAAADRFNIGVLHTSLTGSTQHDPYAPTSVQTLLQRGYDYWALGHIHQRSDPPIHENPHIVYSGNTQGRHIHECGAKGCLLVSVADGEVARLEFCETDTVRWQTAEVKLSENDDVAALLEAVQRQLAACCTLADNRLLAIRLTISGACVAHRTLVNPSDWEETQAEIRNMANELDGLWMEKVALETRPPIDIDQLKTSPDLIGELLRMINTMAADDGQLATLAGELDGLHGKLGVELEQLQVDLKDPDQLRRWLNRAGGLIVDNLLEVDG
jgi:DNA repair exonuclease SbcCD nuclease subunit